MAIAERPNQHKIARKKADELKADRDVTMVWPRLGVDGVEHVIAERRGGKAERHSVHPDGRTTSSSGSIDHSRDDRGHPARVTRFVPDSGESTEIDRREF